MKLFLLIFLFFYGCAIEGPDKYYHLEVWEQENKMIRVSYCAELTGYTIFVGCNLDELELNTARLVRGHDIQSNGEYVFTRICDPMYIRVKSKVADEIVKI